MVYWPKEDSKRGGIALFLAFMSFLHFIIFFVGHHTVNPLAKGGYSGNLNPPVPEVPFIAGSYNITVLTPRSVADLQQWLNGHGYRALDTRESGVMEAVLRSDWCLVASELRKAEGGTGETLSPHPLAITFPTREPVYPLRLTALASDRLSLRLLVFAEHTCRIAGFEAFCGGALSKTEVQGKTCYENREEKIGNPLLVEEGWDRYVFTALSGQLDAENMAKDLRIGRGSDRQSVARVSRAFRGPDLFTDPTRQPVGEKPLIGLQSCAPTVDKSGLPLVSSSRRHTGVSLDRVVDLL